MGTATGCECDKSRWEVGICQHTIPYGLSNKTARQLWNMAYNLGLATKRPLPSPANLMTRIKPKDYSPGHEASILRDLMKAVASYENRTNGISFNPLAIQMNSVAINGYGFSREEIVAAIVALSQLDGPLPVVDAVILLGAGICFIRYLLGIIQVKDGYVSLARPGEREYTGKKGEEKARERALEADMPVPELTDEEIEDAGKALETNVRAMEGHIIQRNGHGWGKLFPNPRGPDNWPGIVAVIQRVLRKVKNTFKVAHMYPI